MAARAPTVRGRGGLIAVGWVLVLVPLAACAGDDDVPMASGGSGSSSSTSDPPGEDDVDRVSAEQAALFDDLERVRAHGVRHRDTWAGVRFVNEPAVKIQAAFTSDIDERRRELEALVDHPDRIDVVAAPRSEAELHRIRSEIEAELMSHDSNVMLSLGESWLRLELQLIGWAEPIAEKLHARHGDAVALSVGALPYPPEVNGASVCPPRPRARGENPGYRATLAGDGLGGRSGDSISTTLVVTNTTDGPLMLESGQPLLGVVLDEKDERVVGVHVGAIAGTGVVATLAPGATHELAVFIGTASCDPATGYVLPPGRYRAVAEMPIRSGEVPPSEAPVIVTAPISIELS